MPCDKDVRGHDFVHVGIGSRIEPNTSPILQETHPGCESRASNHDVLLAYQRGDVCTWNVDETFVPYKQDDLDEKTDAKYSLRESDGRRYQLTSLLNPNQDRPNLTYEFLGVTRVWRWEPVRMQRAHDEGLVIQTKPGSAPRYKRYLDKQRGKPCGDVWTDIPPVNSQAAERLGYPTQKPVALLERIIRQATREGDVVLDPFCGCGTAVHAAEKLKRQWIGIDITCLATNLIKHRLADAFAGKAEFEVNGEPTTLAEAEQLATEDRFQFQCWALGFVSARATEQKRGADKGIDGRLYFHEGQRGEGTKQIIFSVKSGHVQVKDVRELQQVVAREKAQLGALLTLEPPTGPMKTEAAAAGFYDSPWGRHPKTQIPHGG